MAFDSVGLAGKAQNRLHKAPWSRVNNKKEIWENTECEADQRDAEKKHLQSWQQIANRKCHKVRALELYCLTEYYSILQQACPCVHVYAYAYVQLQCSIAREKVRPCSQRDPPVGLGSRNKLIGLTALSSSCSPILEHECAQTQTRAHTHSHIHTCPAAFVFVLSSAQKPLHTTVVLHCCYMMDWRFSLPLIRWVGLKWM